eukprot:scaffold2800_cov283-Chaetoceros_neogracile.AAC.7
MSVGDASVRTGISSSASSASSAVSASDANVDSRDRSRTRTRTAARISARDNNDDAACHITNIVQMNRSRRMQNRAGGSHGYGYGHGHGQGSSKSLSGKSVTSIKSQREVRNAEIARTVIRQARDNSSTVMATDPSMHASKMSSMVADDYDDSISVVSNYTVHDILGDLTDPTYHAPHEWEDTKSIKSIHTSNADSRSRSRSRRSHSRNRSQTRRNGTTGTSLASLPSSIWSKRRSKSRSKSNLHARQNEQGFDSRSTASKLVRQPPTSRDRSRTRSNSKGRLASVSSSIRLPQANEATNEGETERLYNAFMKNLSREEKLAHATEVLSNASDVKATISAEQMIGRNYVSSTVRKTRIGSDRENKSAGGGIAQWAIDLFDNSQGDDKGVGTFHDTTALDITTEAKMDLPNNIRSRSRSTNAIIKKTALHESRFSPASETESFQLESFDPEKRSNAFEFDTAASPFAGMSVAKNLRTQGSKAPIDIYSAAHNFKDAFGPLETAKAVPRYSFADGITPIPRRTRPSTSKLVPNSSPSRDDIAPSRRASSSLASPTTSKYSFVPMATSKAANPNVSSPAIAKDNNNGNGNDNVDTESWNDFGSKKNNGRSRTPQHVETPDSSDQDDVDDAFRQAECPDPFPRHDAIDNVKSHSSDPFAPSPRRNGTEDKSRNNDVFQNGTNAQMNDGSFGWKGFGTSSAFETIPSGWDTEEEDDSDNDDGHDGFLMEANSGPSKSTLGIEFKGSSFPVAASPPKSEWSDTSPTGVAEFDPATAEWLKGSNRIKTRKEDTHGKNRHDRGLPRMNLFSKDCIETSSSARFANNIDWV